MCISWKIKCLTGTDKFSSAHFGLFFLVLFYQHRRPICSCSNKGLGIKTKCYDHVFFHGSTAIVGHGLLISEALQPHTLRHTTLGRTPRDERSDRRRDLYLTAHNNQETDTHVAGGIRTRNPNKGVAADPRLRQWPPGSASTVTRRRDIINAVTENKSMENRAQTNHPDLAIINIADISTL